MGEAVYYLIAEFRNNKQLRIVSNLVEPIIKELAEFQDYWQNTRHEKGTVRERYNHLKEKYPLAFEYLNIPKPEDDDTVMNRLAGYCDMTVDYRIYYDDNKFTLSCEVWHFANWKPLVRLMFQLGAVKCHYYSDEYMDEIIEDIKLSDYYSNTGEYPELNLEKLKEDIMVAKI